jgi:hypothetical protein
VSYGLRRVLALPRKTQNPKLRQKISAIYPLVCVSFRSIFAHGHDRTSDCFPLAEVGHDAALVRTTRPKRPTRYRCDPVAVQH